jgi:hypothetical protein
MNSGKYQLIDPMKNGSKDCLFWNEEHQVFTVVRLMEIRKSVWYFLDDTDYTYRQIKTYSRDWDFWAFYEPTNTQ